MGERPPRQRAASPARPERREAGLEAGSATAAFFAPRRSGGVSLLDLALLDEWVRVTSDDARLLEELATCYEPPPDGPPRRTEPDLRIAVRTDRTRRVRAVAEVVSTPRPAARATVPILTSTDLCSAITQWVAERSPRCVFHAAAVEWSGRAVLLPGRSRAGKSTLTASLVAGGLPLFSDELAAVDLPSRRVAAYPRCLSIRNDVLDTLGLDPSLGARAAAGEARLVRADELGGRRADTEAAVAGLLFPSFDPGVPLRMEELSAAEAVVALMENSASQGRLKTEGFDWVLSLVRSVPRQRVVYADVHRAASAVQARLRSWLGSGP